MKKILFFFLLPIILFAQRPTLSDVTFYGGTGDQRASGVILKNSNIYISGADAAILTGQSLAMSYSIPVSSVSTPVWAVRWPNKSTISPDVEQFAGVTAAYDGVYFPGWSYSQTTDGAGGKENKSVFVKFPFGGGTGLDVAGCTWYGHSNFFPYTGGEGFSGTSSAFENGRSYLYAAGWSEPGFGGAAYVVAKYDTLGNLLKAATDTTVGVKFSGGSIPTGGGSSYSFSITNLNGTIFASGFSGWAMESDKDTAMKPTIWKYDQNLNLQQRFKGINSGIFYAITNDGSSLYAVGYANSSSNKEDFLIVKYDTNGNILWRRTYGGGNSDILKTIMTSGSRIFAAGSTKSAGAGGSDAILMELNPSNGDTLYTVTYGGTQDDIGNGLAISGTDLYLVGESKSYANGGNVVGQNDVMILKYKLQLSSPTITDFSPKSGPVGTTLTITGTNFSNIIADNIVYFGAVKGMVATATSTQLTVTVPSGATYQPFTVMVNGLTAYSTKPFIVTFSSNGVIDVNSFNAKVDFTSGSNPSGVAIGDIDGDGKTDIAITNNTSNTVSVFRNTSTSGAITSGSFAVKVDFIVGGNPFGVIIGDIDGDGKQDLVATNTGNATISVLRNTSTTGTINSGSFATKVDFSTGGNPYSIAMRDIDEDGKPELAVTNFNSNTISIFRNTSTTGSITSGSFATAINFTAGLNPSGIAISDIDGDGRQDFVVSNNGGASVSIFRHTDSSGAVRAGSFSSKVDFAAGTNPNLITIGDIDGDGKTDLVVNNHSSNTVSVFRNTSTSGSITTGSLATKVDFSTGANPYNVSIGNIDGDGKPDIATANSGSATLSVFRNTSSPGSINSSSFGAKVDFTIGASPNSNVLGDMDGDGKTDIVVSSYTSNTISVLRNIIATAAVPATPTNLSASAISTSQVNLSWTASVSGSPTLYRIYRSLTSGTGFSKIDSISSGITVYSNTTLAANTVYWYRVTALNASGESNPSVEDSAKTLTANSSIPTITSFTPLSGYSGSSVTITGTNFGSTQSSSTVKFGTTTASVTSWSATQIIVTVPSVTAGLYTISVTTAGGVVNSSTQFTVLQLTYPDPLPALSKTVVSTVITTGTINYMTEENGILWMGGANGVIAKSSVTPTAGSLVTWALSNSGISFAETIYTIEFASSTLGFAGTGTGKIYRTTDGGTSWSLVYNNANITNFINTIKFFNSTVGIAVGDGLSSSNIMAYLYTTDGGTTWNNNNTYLFGSTSPTMISFPSSTAGYSIGSYNISAKSYKGFFKTTNNGTNWVFYTIGNSSKDSTISSSCIEFLSATVGLVVRSDSTVWETTNGGSKWSIVGQLPRMGYGITFVSSSVAYIAGASGLIAQINYSNNTINAVLHNKDLFFSRPVYSATLGALYIPDEDQTRTYYTSMNPSSPLTTPLLSTPSNGSQITGNAVSMSWSSVSGATAYDIEIGTVISSSIKGTINTSTTTGLYVEHLAPATTYQWRVRARSLTNSSVWSALSSFTVPYTQTVSNVIPAAFSANPKSSTDYRLITIPTSTSITVGKYLTGAASEFRIFSDNGGTPPNHLVEMNANSTLLYGKGYWLVKKNNFSLNGNIDFPTPVNGIVTISLKSSSWNIIGNPFPVAVKWSDIVTVNGLTSGALLYGYTGAAGFVKSDIMEPYVGYYYFSNSTSLSVPFPFSPTPNMIQTVPLSSFSLVYSSSFNSDRTAFVGIDPSSLQGIDDFEVRKPPVFSDQGSIWFDRTEWDGRNSRFSSDVRPTLGDGQTWDFVLQHSNDETARLSLESMNQLPKEYEIIFINKQTGVVLKPDDKNGVAIVHKEGTTPYSLIIGKHHYIQSQIESYVPNNFVLHQNYPNPFNPSTTIRFGIVSDAHVQLKIYDLLGRQVMQLVNQTLAGGNHEYVFNGKNLASGTYVYSLRVSSPANGNVIFSSIRKMMLIK